MSWTQSPRSSLLLSPHTQSLSGVFPLNFCLPHQGHSTTLLYVYVRTPVSSLSKILTHLSRPMQYPRSTKGFPHIASFGGCLSRRTWLSGTTLFSSLMRSLSTASSPTSSPLLGQCWSVTSQLPAYSDFRADACTNGVSLLNSYYGAFTSQSDCVNNRPYRPQILTGLL